MVNTRSLKARICQICDYTTFFKGSLKKHADTIHSQLKPHKCHLCDYITSLKGNLKQHIEGNHSQFKLSNL